MNWKTFLGEELYEKMNEYLSNKKMTIATLVRLAVEEYIKK
jgi:predicted DNA-binding protein